MIILNLLPPAIKEEYQSSEQLRHWLKAVMIVTLMMLLGTGSMVGLMVMMQRHAATVKTELQQLQQHQATSNGKDIASTTGQLNTTIKLFTTALGTPRSWSADSVTVLTGLPTTITIKELSIQLNGQFRLIGTADSRQSFVELETALKANPKLSKITTTTTASKRVAVPFDFSGLLVTSPQS